VVDGLAACLRTTMLSIQVAGEAALARFLRLVRWDWPVGTVTVAGADACAPGSSCVMRLFA